MWDDWDFIVDYSHEHRTGTRPLGIGYGVSTSRPIHGLLRAQSRCRNRSMIAPESNAFGEYVGTTPWGTRWNTQLKYSGSFYSNDNKSMEVQNPFCITCSV